MKIPEQRARVALLEQRVARILPATKAVSTRLAAEVERTERYLARRRRRRAHSR